MIEERNLVEQRIEEIKKNKENAGINREIIISGGEAVLKENAEEFKALKRLLEILDNKMQQNSKFEYLEEREKTTLPGIPPEQHTLFIDAEYQRMKEKENVESRMTSIESDARMAGKGYEFIIASNGKTVKKSDLEEYEKLVQMQNIINNKFLTNKYYDYMNLRVETKLGQMSDIQYMILMGRENPNKIETWSNKENKVTSAKINSEPEISIQETLTEVEPTAESVITQDDLAKDEFAPQPVIILPDSLENNKKESAAELSEKQSEKSNSPTSLEPYSKTKDELAPIEVTDYTITDATDTPRRNDAKIIDVDPNKIKDVSEDEELVEVVKTTPWQWIKDHKKQILIALGITALTITTVVALTQLLPAIAAAAKASQVAGIATQMVTNGQMWHTAIASEQLALHGANTALADVISGLSGVANSFNVSSGVWTIGGQTLPQFAQTAAVAAEAAAGKVSLLTNISTITGVGGLGALGAGLLSPKKKSSAYRQIKKKIDELKAKIDTLNEENKAQEIEAIMSSIIRSNELSTSERNILLKKLNTLVKKAKLTGQQAKAEIIDVDFKDVEIDEQQYLEESNELMTYGGRVA